MAEDKNHKDPESQTFDKGILVTDDQGSNFPILHFDLVVIVEPDQFKWTPDRVFDLDNELDEIWDIQSEMISHETFSEDALENLGAEVDLVENTRFLWLRNYAFNYYGKFAGGAAQIAFHYDDNHDISEDMQWYLQVAYNHHPNWRVAIIGGLFEVDVVKAANQIHAMGFNTTVLTRYCLSTSGFRLIKPGEEFPLHETDWN